MSNLIKMEYPENGITLLAELQSIPIRILDEVTGNQIGSCLIVGSGVGQGVVKLLYIDEAYRSSHFKGVHKSLIDLGAKLGFTEKVYQRYKGNDNFLNLSRLLKNKANNKENNN